MFKLVISDDEGKTTVVPLVREEITIGRKEGNTIRLTERNVSRRHARLRRKNGGFVVEDLGSYNGVRINGDRIEGEVKLRAGDKVMIGDYELALQADGVDEHVDPPSDSVPISIGDLPEPVPPARLVMLTAPAPGAEYALGSEPMRIGRSEELDIWVNHRSISREHACFVREGDVYRVKDLDSANGVRVNGADVTEAELQSGDILELGQVRFRFVGEGETYVFDAEDAHAVDAMLDEGETSRAPIMAAIVIIVVAIAAGAAIAMSSDPEPTTPPEVAAAEDVRDPAPTPAVAAPSPEDVARAAEAARSCESALGEGRFEDALRFAAEALSADASNATAAACRTSAQAAAAEHEILGRGRAALEANDVDGAYFAFEELPLESPLRQDPAVARARRAFVERHLALARRAYLREPVEAVRQANIVLTVEGVGERERREAELIVARASRRIPASAATPSTPEPEPDMEEEVASSPSAMTARDPRASARTPGRTTGRTDGPGSQLASPMAAETLADAPSPIEQARACLETGDHRCAVRALEGHSGSAGALALLIESYLALGDHASAIRHMRSFVARYPDDRRTERYRRFLDTLQ